MTYECYNKTRCNASNIHYAWYYKYTTEEHYIKLVIKCLQHEFTSEYAHTGLRTDKFIYSSFKPIGQFNKNSIYSVDILQLMGRK